MVSVPGYFLEQLAWKKFTEGDYQKKTNKKQKKQTKTLRLKDVWYNKNLSMKFL